MTLRAHPSRILLAHGSGGRHTRDLIKELLLAKLDNPVLQELADSARLDYDQPLAFTTDSFVVSPLFFPGGDIGRLSVCGTVNDLAMLGALPEHLSLALIIEEGLGLAELERIVDSIALVARRIKARFVTGDVKVVERGACDRLFINTSGVGRVVSRAPLSLRRIKAGDRIILSGDIGRHGLAVLGCRSGFEEDLGITSDCAPLSDLLLPVVRRTEGIRFMRDPTRGGLATVLNEISQGTGLGVVVEESCIPVSAKVRAACELLGLDPLYCACEGRALIVTCAEEAESVLSLLRRHPLGRTARVIGRIVREKVALVVLNTVTGSQRILDMLSSDPLPRIC